MTLIDPATVRDMFSRAEFIGGMYGLPLEVIYCRLCTSSNQRMASVVERDAIGSNPLRETFAESATAHQRADAFLLTI